MTQATSPSRTRCAVRQNGRVRRHLNLAPVRGCISWCSVEGEHEVCEAEPITMGGVEVQMAYADSRTSISVLGSTWHGIDDMTEDEAQALMIGLAYMLARRTDPATGVAA